MSLGDWQIHLLLHGAESSVLFELFPYVPSSPADIKNLPFKLVLKPQILSCTKRLADVLLQLPNSITCQLVKRKQNCSIGRLLSLQVRGSTKVLWEGRGEARPSLNPPVLGIELTDFTPASSTQPPLDRQMSPARRRVPVGGTHSFSNSSPAGLNFAQMASWLSQHAYWFHHTTTPPV